MSITVISSPTDVPYRTYIPSYNNQWFVGSSTQIAQPNFKYTIVVTDVISGDTITESYSANPSGIVEFDASKFSELLMSNYIPINTYGWQLNDSIRKIRVNIGETYGSTPTYYVGANVDYHVWNGSLEMLKFSQYNSYTYVYSVDVNPSINNPVLLSDLKDDTTFSNRSNFLYFMVKVGTTDLPKIIIKTYKVNGAYYTTSTIPNPFNTSATYLDNMVCIGVGKKDLDNISSGLVTGTYPILDSQVDRYEILCQITTEISPFIIKKYKIKCSPRFDVYTLHYLSTTGAFETLNCSKVTELNSTKTSSTFKRSPWSNVSNVMTLDYSVAVEQAVVVSVQNGLKLTSDWVTKDELLKFKDLFSSPDVKLDLGTSQGYASVKVTNGNYISKNNDKLKNLTFDLLFTHNNQRQKG